MFDCGISKLTKNILRKTKIFKNILDYLFKILCNTLNMFETISIKKKNDIHEGVCHFQFIK